MIRWGSLGECRFMIINSKNVLEHVDVMIRSRYPLIYIISWEEQRVLSSLKQLLSTYRQQRKLYTWSCTDGLCGENHKNIEDTTDLVKALDYMLTADETAIYILKDPHSWLDDPKVTRKFRDFYHTGRKSYKNIVIISPKSSLPQELSKEIVLIDYPLPSISELDKKLEELIRSVDSNPGVTINITPETRESLLKAALGLTLNEAEHVFAKAIVKDKVLDEKDVKEVLFEKQQHIKKTGILEYCDVFENMNDVGGLEYLKDWLYKRSKAFTFKAKQFGLPAPKGVLLLGVQGCGKSLCAKAMSSIWNLPLLKLDVGRVFSSYIGSSEENIRTVIKLAESVAPCLLWIDEVEKAFAGAKNSGSVDGGTTTRIFGTFISWMQEKKSPVFIVATANDVTSLPAEFLRKGRFDEIFFVDLPNVRERERIFEIHLNKFNRPALASPETLKTLAMATSGFNGAEIEHAIIEGLFEAFDDNKDLTADYILKAIQATIPLSQTMGEDVAKLRQWASHRTRPASLSIQEG